MPTAGIDLPDILAKTSQRVHMLWHIILIPRFCTLRKSSKLTKRMASQIDQIALPCATRILTPKSKASDSTMLFECLDSIWRLKHKICQFRFHLPRNTLNPAKSKDWLRRGYVDLQFAKQRYCSCRMTWHGTSNLLQTDSQQLPWPQSWTSQASQSFPIGSSAHLSTVQIPPSETLRPVLWLTSRPRRFVVPPHPALTVLGKSWRQNPSFACAGKPVLLAVKASLQHFFRTHKCTH